MKLRTLTEAFGSLCSGLCFFECFLSPYFTILQLLQCSLLAPTPLLTSGFTGSQELFGCVAPVCLCFLEGTLKTGEGERGYNTFKMRNPVTFESPFESDKKSNSRQMVSNNLQLSASGAYLNVMEGAAPSSHAPATFGNVPLRSVVPSYSVVSAHHNQAQQSQQQPTSAFVPGTLDSLRRHTLLLHYNHPSLPFLEDEFAIYFHLNRIVPITFALVMLSMSLLSAFTVGLSFSADTIWYSIIFWTVWPVTIAVMVLLRQQAVALLASSSTAVRGGEELAHVHSAISMDSSDSRNRMRRNANIHEVCSLLALQSAALICTAIVSTKDDNHNAETTQFLESSILSDGAIVFVMICTVSLCPVRFSRFLPNIVLMNLHFFLSRPLSGFPEIVWNYLWSELTVVLVTSFLCIVTSFFMERRRREEFEELLHLSAHAIHVSSVRERSAALLASQVEGVSQSTISKRHVAGSVLWSVREAIALSVGIENFVTWSSRRSPLDTVEIMMRYVIAIEDTVATTRDFISDVCSSNDTGSQSSPRSTVAMVSSQGIGDVVDLTFRSPTECSFDLFLLPEVVDDDKERGADDDIRTKLVAPSFATLAHFLSAMRTIVGATISMQRRTEEIRKQGHSGSWKSAALIAQSRESDGVALGLRAGIGAGSLCAQLSVLGGALNFRGRAMSEATQCRTIHLPTRRDAPAGASPEYIVASEEFANIAARVTRCPSSSHTISFRWNLQPEGTSLTESAHAPSWSVLGLCLQYQPQLTDKRSTPASSSPREAVNPLALVEGSRPSLGTATIITANILVVPGDVVPHMESLAVIPYVNKLTSVVCGDPLTTKMSERESSTSAVRENDLSQSVASDMNASPATFVAQQCAEDVNDDDNLQQGIDLSGKVAERLCLGMHFAVLPYFTDVEVEASYQLTSRKAEWTIHRSLWLWTSGISISAAMIGIMQLYGLMSGGVIDAMSPALWAIVCLALALIACLIDVIVVEYDDGLNSSDEDGLETSSVSTLPSFDEGFALLFVVSYCAIIVCAPAGNVVGNGRYVWMFFLDCFLLLRPSLRSPLAMWALDLAVSVFFFVDVKYQTRAPGSSYVYFGMILAATHAVYMGAMRLHWDLTQRNRYAIGVHLELLEDELEKDYEKLTDVITGVAPRGIAADMLKKMKSASSRRQLNRLLHPDHSTHLTTTTDDVETLHIYMSYNNNNNNIISITSNVRQAIDKECRLFRNVHFKINKYLATSGARIDVIKAIGSYTVLAVSRDVVNLPDRKDKGHNGATALLKAVPQILSILRSESQFGFDFSLLLNSGPLTGAVVGNEHCSFDYYGPSVTQSSALVRHLCCGSCMATSRFVAKFAIGVEKVREFDVLQPLQVAFAFEVTPTVASPKPVGSNNNSSNRSKDSVAASAVHISPVQFWKLRGLPRIGLHTVTFTSS